MVVLFVLAIGGCGGLAAIGVFDTPKPATSANQRPSATTGPTATTVPATEPTRGEDNDEDAAVEADAAGSEAPAGLPAPQPSSYCRTDPLANVYHPSRLHVIDECRTVSGVVSKAKRENDGDYHINVDLDAAFTGMVNQANRTKQAGALVVEVVPADLAGCTPGQPARPPDGDKNYGTCTAANVVVPKAGTHVWVVGPYVLDTAHGWMEIHPAWAIIETDDVAAAGPPSTTTAPTTTTPATPVTTAAPVPTTAPPPPAPPASPAPTQPSKTYVTPGAFCGPEGATGYSKNGVAMVCSYKPGDPRLRWRAA